MSATRANPFVGLRPFEADEAMLFFGRDEQTLELLERLHQNRFLAVVGSSGCGKSSLVRAGLLSKLRAGLLTVRDRWQVATLRPGSRPFAELAAALAEAHPGNTGIAAPSFAEALHTGGLTPLLEALAPAFVSGDTSLLLVIDQFEELFRFGLQSGDEARREEAMEFVALLLGLARQTALPAYAVITLRSDFLGDCDAFRGLPEALNEGQYLVPRLPRDKRQEAIEGPVRLFGKRIAPRLVDRLLNDGGAAPDQLPVLQHTLLRVWEAAGNAEELDVPHYETVGGLAQALSKHAGEALADLRPEDLALTEKIFRALTTTDANNRQIRRPRTLAQLAEETGAEPERIVRVIDVFRAPGRSFLMPPSKVKLEDDTLIDISHESLIRQWETLRGWAAAETEAGKIYRRLAEDAERYAAGKGSLLVDRALAVAREWSRETRPTEAWARRYGGNFGPTMSFLEESDRRDRRRARRARGVQITLAGLFLLVSALGVFSFLQWRKAQDKAFEASFNLAQIYEEKAISALKSDSPHAHRKAWLYSVAALSQPVGDRRLPAAVGMLLAPEVRAGAFAELWRSPGPSGPIFQVAFSPDGSRLASSAEGGTIHVWDVQTGRDLMTLPKPSDGIRSMAFSLGGSQLATGSRDGAVRIWDLSTGKVLSTLQRHSGKVSSVAFSPDRKHLASGSEDRTIRIWDLSTGQAVATLRHDGGVISVTYSSDGSRLASRSSDRTARVWDVKTGRQLATTRLFVKFLGSEPGSLGEARSVTFSPDGSRLALGLEAGLIEVRHMEAGDYRRDGFLSSHSRAVSSMDFSFDGRFLGSGSLDQSIRVWSLETGQSLATFQTDGGAIKSVAFSPDGRRLASGSLNGRVRLWGLAMAQGIAPVRNPWFPALKEVFDRNGQPVLSPDGHQIPDSPKGRPRIRRESRGEVDQIVRQAFSPDGRRFATVYSSGTIEVLGGKQGLTVLASKDRDRLAEKAELAFSPDGRRLAANVFGDPIKILDTVTGKTLVTLEDSRGSSNSLVFSPDGRQLASALGNDVHLWDIARAKKITIFQGRESARSLAFSPDGRRLAFGSDDRTIQVFDLGNHRLLATLQGHTGPVFSVKFSPDGQRLASGSEDRTIRLWDLANYQPEATLFGHQETVTSLAFTPDGRRLASSSADGTIRYWLTSLPESLQSPQTRADSFAKIYEASLQELRYRPDELDFDPIEDSIDETPSFAFRRPRPLDQDLLEWLLEVGEALPKEPVDSFPSRAVLFQKH